MLEFLFPWTMAAGGALVASPIIIHLINRMRFKRIRWAAMEFLLKSQKRNRRRLIIEQLILLLLRILLVLLIALIVARFLGFAFGMFEPQNRQHIILLDDTPSMTDQWQEEGESKVSFKEAKRLIVEEIARNAALGSQAQQLKLLALSRPGEVLFDQRLNDQTTKELAAALTQIEPSFVHVDLMQGIEKAKEQIEKTAPDLRILYIVSDFRQIDWSGPTGDRLTKELAALSEAGVHVKLVDVANPPRREAERDAGFHENLAIVRLEPQYRVVARNMPPTPFTVTVANYGLTERQNVQVRVKLNGRDEAGSSVPIRSIPAGGQVDATFHVYLDQVGINQVSANIEPEEAGLQVDDSRFATIEVRERVPILLVDGDPSRSKLEGGDIFYMQVLFGGGRGVAPGYDLALGTLADLEKPDIDQYPSVYLINVRELNDKALANLDHYVREGGSLAFFLGEQINADFYNKRLHAGGNGLFPVPLNATPTPELTDEEKLTRMFTDLANKQEQVFVRQGQESHPVFSGLMAALGPRQQYRQFFQLVNVDRHWPVARAKWDVKPGQVDELLTLPNRRSIDDYKDGVNAILGRLPLDDPQFARYRGSLLDYRDRIRGILTSSEPLYKLANLLDNLLHDVGDNTDKRPNLAQMWQQDSVRSLRTDLERLVETVRYGDPLLVTGKYGKGRVVVWLTSLGKKWTSWPLSPTFVMLQVDLQKHLTGIGGEADLTVGTPLPIQLDAARYQTTMRRWFKPETTEAKPGQPANEGQARGLQDMGKQEGSIVEGRVRFTFADARKPGAYVLDFFPRVEEGVDPRPESRGLAFNLDARAEGDLRRAVADDIVLSIAGSEHKDYVRFYTLGSDSFTDLKGKEADLSEGPWLYLIFLLILLVEQALAVHLSYHLKGNEAAPPVAALKATTSVSV